MPRSWVPPPVRSPLPEWEVAFLRAAKAAGWGACYICGWFGRQRDEGQHGRSHGDPAPRHGAAFGEAQPTCRAADGPNREPCRTRTGHPAHRGCWRHFPASDGRPAYARTVTRTGGAR